MTLNGRAVRAGATGAPVFDEAIAWSTATCARPTTSARHTLFVGEVVDAGVSDDEARPAAMSDTRMKYGGIKRH